MPETPPDQPSNQPPGWREIRRKLRAAEAQDRAEAASRKSPRSQQTAAPTLPCTCDQCSRPLAFNAMLCFSCGRFYVVQTAWNLFLVNLVLAVALGAPLLLFQLLRHL